MLRPTVSRAVYLGVKPLLVLRTRFLLFSDNCWFVDVERPLWREDRFVVYNCCWSSSAQSFSGPSPAGLMTMFYCLRFETPQTRRTRFPYLHPPRTRWPSYTPRHWVPFSSPPTSRRATVEVLEPASTWAWLDWTTSPRYTNIAPAWTAQKSLFHYCVFSRCREKNVSIGLFPSNGCCTVACLHSCYLAMGPHVTIYLEP
jgi:hypothetical protein